SDELHHAVNDVVSACASNKPTNALPPLLRAQTSAASLTAALEVLSRFVALTLQTGPRSPLEAQITDLVGRAAPQPAPAQQRRANRVAKVSMQDIKMLRPEQVRLGRENRDLCVRLKDDIEKAHREYDRRFRPIMDHPVDYFYRWLVEILADGDPHALGEYPY